ncbi:SDR family oxidoreductase [Rhodobacteraceae bacterium NNCM2]|nr:SDR family oxidoreductase [Coraliihabitans acroporae]
MTYHLIIGAGTGIGAELARRIAAPGARMLIHTGRNRDGLEMVADQCREKGASVEICLGDLAGEELFDGVSAWLDTVPEGELTSVVFAAGYARFGGLEETPLEALSQGLQAMPVAFHRLVAMALPKLTPSRGRVVVVSAFGAHRAKSHRFAATGPAKAAIEAQVRIFAADLAPRGITVNAVVPGFIEKEPGTPSSLTPAQWQRVTDAIPMARIGRRSEVAATIAFLLSEEAGYITGQSIHVNGGLTL